jgi:hypothetical protein
MPCSPPIAWLESVTMRDSSTREALGQKKTCKQVTPCAKPSYLCRLTSVCRYVIVREQGRLRRRNLTC